MKNYVQLFLTVETDGSGHLITYSWSQSIDEANEILKTYTNPLGPPQPFYILLNKFNVQQLCLSATGLMAPQSDCTMPPNDTLYTQDDDSAQNWGTDAAKWFTDPKDEASEKALETAKKIRSKSYSTTAFTTTILATITDIWQLFLRTGKFAEADAVFKVLTKYKAGNLTDTQALDLMTKIAEQFA